MICEVKYERDRFVYKNNNPSNPTSNFNSIKTIHYKLSPDEKYIENLMFEYDDNEVVIPGSDRNLAKKENLPLNQSYQIPNGYYIVGMKQLGLNCNQNNDISNLIFKLKSGNNYKYIILNNNPWSLCSWSVTSKKENVSVSIYNDSRWKSGNQSGSKTIFEAPEGTEIISREKDWIIDKGASNLRGNFNGNEIKSVIYRIRQAP